MKPKLSVIVIARDEERDLPACLESVRGLDAEIIVLDSGSTDRTREIARRFTPHVFQQPFRDFGSQKQSALERASGEWVLSIDADERLSGELRLEIARLIESPPGGVSGYDIPFEVHFMGRRLRFGGLGRERHLRLFRRGAGVFTGNHLHEGVSVTGATARAGAPIRHIPYRDLDDYLGKLRVYTTRAARKRFDQGRRFHPLHHLLPLWEFFLRVVVRLGMLDGTPGLLWAGLSSFHTWIKYVKLREIAEEPGSLPRLGPASKGERKR
ncbi:MAG: glycosyltransferase family 2 protein [Elusimicrobiota bacterium]